MLGGVPEDEEEEDVERVLVINHREADVEAVSPDDDDEDSGREDSAWKKNANRKRAGFENIAEFNLKKKQSLRGNWLAAWRSTEEFI